MSYIWIPPPPYSGLLKFWEVLERKWYIPRVVVTVVDCNVVDFGVVVVVVDCGVVDFGVVVVVVVDCWVVVVVGILAVVVEEVVVRIDGSEK